MIDESRCPACLGVDTHVVDQGRGGSRTWECRDCRARWWAMANGYMEPMF